MLGTLFMPLLFMFLSSRAVPWRALRLLSIPSAAMCQGVSILGSIVLLERQMEEFAAVNL